jgi:hypothetical protein
MMTANEVSYCGLYCANCFIRVGKIRELAAQVVQEFEEVKFAEWGPKLPGLVPEMNAFEFSRECLETLRAWDNMSCGNSCKNGGGSGGCSIRKCCVEKGIDGCWECVHSENCDTLDWLKPVNGTQNIENIGLIKEKGLQHFIDAMSAKKYSGFYK